MHCSIFGICVFRDECFAIMIWKYILFFLYAHIRIRTGNYPKAVKVHRKSAKAHFSTKICVFLLISAQSIGCFKCTSVNGDNPACEDPFHNNVSGKSY